MKHQALFSLKDKSRKNKSVVCCTFAWLFKVKLVMDLGGTHLQQRLIMFSIRWKTMYTTMFFCQFFQRENTFATSYLFPWEGLPWSGKNIWKLKFFQIRKKSGNFVEGQGNLERT